jgi:hypothetical protein
MIDSLAENFKTRFNGLSSHATYVRMSEDPFLVEISDTPEKLQFEVTELQYDTVLRSSFNQEALVTFCASLPVSRFAMLCKLAQYIS